MAENIIPGTLDDWNRHWSDFGAFAELGPTPKYRRRLILNLLRNVPIHSSARMLELASPKANIWGWNSARLAFGLHASESLPRAFCNVICFSRPAPLTRDLSFPQRMRFARRFSSIWIGRRCCFEMLPPT